VKAKIMILVAVLLALVGCDPDDVVLGPQDNCEVGAMRCNGNVVEACGSDQRWVTSMDCDEVAAMSGGVWSCVPDEDAGPYCAPECDEDAGVYCAEPEDAGNG